MNRPYFSCAPGLRIGSGKPADFWLPQTVVNPLRWSPDIRDTKTPSQLNQDCLMDDISLITPNPRRTAGVSSLIRPNEEGRTQYFPIKIKSGFTIHLKPRRSTALHIAVIYYSTLSLYLWPCSPLPQNFPFPILPLVKLQTFPNFHSWSYLVFNISKPIAQVNCH